MRARRIATLLLLAEGILSSLTPVEATGAVFFHPMVVQSESKKETANRAETPSQKARAGNDNSEQQQASGENSDKQTQSNDSNKSRSSEQEPSRSFLAGVIDVWNRYGAFVGLVLLLLFAGSLAYIARMKRIIRDSQERANFNQEQLALIREIKSKQDELLKQLRGLDEIRSSVKLILGEVEELREHIRKLKERLETRSSQETPGLSVETVDNAAPTTATDSFALHSSQSADRQEFDRFPISVADYLNYISETSVVRTEVRAEPLREGVFVKSPEGVFLLVGYDGNPNKRLFVVPKMERFQTRQDFIHFQRYYDCNNPSSGEVWIIRPAVVVTDTVRGEWNLVEKGQLEIRS